MNKTTPVSKGSQSKRGDCRIPELKVTTEYWLKPWYKEERAIWRIRERDEEVGLKDKQEFTRKEAGKLPTVASVLMNAMSIYLVHEYL